MNNLLLRLVSVVVLVCFCPIAVFAKQEFGLTLSNELGQKGHGDEFVSGDIPGAVMMKVNLWGAVGKPGIHYVPAKTNLLTLLSYAGGLNYLAESDSIIVHRLLPNGKEESFEVDGDKILRGTGEYNPVLEANDLVVVPSKSPPISTNTMTMIGFVTGILSLVVMSISLSSLVKK